MKQMWTCPRCKRMFTRSNQRHVCGVGTMAEVFRDRPEEVVALYGALQDFVNSLGPVEFVARERYVLLRSRRVFADMGIMTDAIRLAIHLDRTVGHDLFFKIAADQKSVTHVAKLRLQQDIEEMKPFLREAYELSLRDVQPGRAPAAR